MEEQKKTSIKKVPLLAMLVILTVALAGGLYLYKNKEESAKNSLPSGWVEYKNDKYGFKFNYLGDWGGPIVSETIGDTGKTYTIVFANSDNPSSRIETKSSLSIRFDSLDYSKRICAADDGSSCTTIKAFTGEQLAARLKSKSNLALYDESSYATIASQGGINETQMTALNVHKKVVLSRINADALQASYIMYGIPASCKKDNFSTDEGADCLKKTHYENVGALLSSFKNL